MLPKIIALIFSLIVISKTIIDFRKKQENWQMFLFWIVVWLGIVIIAFYPMIIQNIIIRFGAGSYTIGQIIGIGFVFIMYIVYRVYIKAHRIEHQLNLMVRNFALKGLKKKNKTPRF